MYTCMESLSYRAQIPERFTGSNDGKSMTAHQPHQTMDYVLLERLDRSPQLSRLIMPRVVLLAGVHWPGEKNQQLVFVIHISISTVLQERNQTTLLNLGKCTLCCSKWDMWVSWSWGPMIVNLWSEHFLGTFYLYVNKSKPWWYINLSCLLIQE